MFRMPLVIVSALALAGCAPDQAQAPPPQWGTPQPQWGAPQPQWGAPQPQWGAPQAQPIPAPQASACGGVSGCNACASVQGCAWCTTSQACQPAGSACAGLSLASPATCINDPVEAARIERQNREAQIASLTQGLTPEGPPVIGNLENFPGVEFAIARGRCYSAIVRLADGAKLGDVSERRDVKTREEHTNGGSVAQPADPNLRGRVACPRSPGRLRVYYVERWTYAPVTKAGHGQLAVQLYSVPISEAELRAGDARAAEIDRRIQRMPAGCDDCDYDCRSAGTDCERRCFVDLGGRSWGSTCEQTCKQITRACQRSCESRCR